MNSAGMNAMARRWPAAPAYVALPVGALVLLCVGATSAALDGRMSGNLVAVSCGVIVLVATSCSEAQAALPLAVVAWMTASAFARAPYGRLQPATHQAAVAAVLILGGVVAGAILRLPGQWPPQQRRTLEPVTGLVAFAAAVDRRRQALGLALALLVLPFLTALLTDLRAQLSLTDNLLIYLLAVVGVALIGGFWPAV